MNRDRDPGKQQSAHETAKREVVLTFDLENWFQIVGRRFAISPGRDTRGRLRAQVRNILEALARHDARATFFILGMSAEACPEVVKDVSAAGHEVASHGYAHGLVRTLGPAAFRADLERSVAILGDLTGASPAGYRAPEFSIDRASFWAFDVLLDCGFSYDSSVYPFGGRRYGIADFPLDPAPVRAPSGRSIVELPLAVAEIGGRRVPVAGGGSWRALPEPALEWALERVARRRVPVLYFHPAELDARALDPPLRRLEILRMAVQQNLGRATIAGKLEALLGRFRCVTAADLARRAIETPAARPAA